MRLTSLSLLLLLLLIPLLQRFQKLLLNLKRINLPGPLKL